MTIETSHDSAIMTYGLAKDPRRPWILGLCLLLGLGLIMAILMFFGLRRPIPEPVQTVFRTSLTPAAAQKGLPASVRVALPVLWQQALEGDSIWPVILGISQEESGWKSYAIVPRWQRGRIKQMEGTLGDRVRIQSYGLALLVTESSVSSDKTLSYTKDAYWWTKKGWAGFQAMPSVLFSASSTQQLSISSFSGYLMDDRIVTDLAFSGSGSSEPLQSSDISFTVPQTPPPSVHELVRRHLPLGDRPQVFTNIDFSQINLFLGSEGEIQQTILSFREPLEKQMAREVLSSFGIVSKRVIQIEDGTVTVEQTLLDPKYDDTLFSGHVTERFGMVSLTPQTLTWGTSTASFTTAPHVCAPAKPWARLSVRAVDQLLQGMGILLPIEMLRSLQFLESEGKLIVCVEN